ncbi:MAG: GDP-L-fucose synthase [Firmicutes bacterium]|nr:GDP-L-fucose synthase [Bacillota bacterium]
MPLETKIYVAGHQGLVGSAIMRALQHRGYRNIIVRSRSELDLRDRQAVLDFFRTERPEYVYLAAARVGGIWANMTYPVEFLQDNLYIELNVISAAHAFEVKKLLFLGSSCIYPRLAPQPIKEEYLLTGALEPTNQPYAIAKIAGIELVNAYRRQYGVPFISAMPTNLYGPGDNFDLETSHVLPALLRKMHEAKLRGEPTVTVWGTGTPKREFLHVDDLAEACLFLMERYDDSVPINIGTGEDISIRELAELIRDIVGFGGEIVFDPTKPDGMPRKLLDVTRITELGWKPRISLREGIELTYRWYMNHEAT